MTYNLVRKRTGSGGLIETTTHRGQYINNEKAAHKQKVFKKCK